MTSEHVEYFENTLGFTRDRIASALEYLTAKQLAWCFVDGQVIDRGFCERFLAAQEERVTP